MSREDFSNMSSNSEPFDLLTRREAIQRVSVLFGGVALVGHAALLDAHAGAPAAPVLSSTDVALLDEMAETMLPETSTPGAKAAEVVPAPAHTCWCMVTRSTPPPSLRAHSNSSERP